MSDRHVPDTLKIASAITTAVLSRSEEDFIGFDDGNLEADAWVSDFRGVFLTTGDLATLDFRDLVMRFEGEPEVDLDFLINDDFLGADDFREEANSLDFLGGINNGKLYSDQVCENKFWNPVMDHRPPRKDGMSSRAKKRLWLETKYDLSGEVKEESKVVCRFFSTTGRCRNGLDCEFLHTLGAHAKINQPCRFLFENPIGCSKGDRCHFSHDLGKFKCPYLNAIGPRSCQSICKFDHNPILSESDRMSFAHMYRSFLTERTAGSNSIWRFYFEETSESERLSMFTRREPDNFFNCV
jgi:hypothetical protein